METSQSSSGPLEQAGSRTQHMVLVHLSHKRTGHPKNTPKPSCTHERTSSEHEQTKPHANMEGKEPLKPHPEEPGTDGDNSLRAWLLVG